MILKKEIAEQRVILVNFTLNLISWYQRVKRSLMSETSKYPDDQLIQWRA